MPKEVAAARAGITNPNAELLKISPSDTADELWARALWLSSADPAPSAEELASVVQAALHRAAHKAPLYVSFGDMTSGSSLWMNVMGNAAETIQTTLGKELIAKAKDLENNKSKGKQNLNSKLVEGVYKDAVIKSVEQMLSELHRAENAAAERSRIFYLAALAEEPANKAAWLRLAWISKGERQARAIAEAIRLDPRNALPYYLRAVDQVERGDLPAALASIQTGNARSICTGYETPLPHVIHFRYPDDEWWRELGVVGRPVPQSEFSYSIGRKTSVFTGFQPLGPPNLLQKMRDSARKFSSEAERLEKSGKMNDAANWLEASHHMGLQLMRWEPRESIVCLVAMAIATDPCSGLKRAYKSLGDKEKLQRTEDDEKRVKHWVKLYTAARYPHGTNVKFDNAPFREAALGKRDLIAEERRDVETTLREAGLIERPK